MRIDLQAQVTLADVRAAGAQFLLWWGQELYALLPATWRAARAHWQRRNQLFLAETKWRLHSTGATTDVELDMSKPDDALLEQLAEVPEVSSRMLDIVLSQEQVLVRRLSVPLAAASRLRSAIGLQIERLSPFCAGDVAFDCRTTASGALDGQVVADICIVPCKTMQSIEDRLARIGLDPDCFVVEGTSFKVPAAASSIRAQRRRKFAFVLAASVALLWGAIGLVAPLASEADVDELNAEIASLRPQAERAASLRKEFESLQEPLRLAEIKGASVRPIDVLKALSVTLPDSARVVELTIEGRHVLITGLAKDAPSLLPLLEKSRRFSGVRFRTPVTRRPDGNDRFEMELNIPEPTAGAKAT